MGVGFPAFDSQEGIGTLHLQDDGDDDCDHDDNDHDRHDAAQSKADGLE